MARKAKVRADGEGSLYFNGGRWKAYVWVPSGKPNGKKKQFVTGKDKEVTRRKWEALKREAERFMPANGEDVTVDQYLNQWLDDVSCEVKPRTLQSYELTARRVVPHVGKVKLRDLKAQHIRDLYKALERKGLSERLDKGLSGRSRQQVHAVLRKAFNDAVRLELIPSNPVALVKPPRAEQSEMQALRDDEVRALFEATKDDRLHALWVLLVNTGTRVGEALALRWGDVDWLAGEVRVTRSLQRQKGKGLVIADVKTRESRRTVPLNGPTVKALRKHQELQTVKSNEDLIFVNTRGGRLDPGNVRESFGRRCKAGGIRTVRVHDLRHTAITFLINQGLPVVRVSKIVGHSRPSTTMNIYAHVMQRDLKGATDCMAVWFERPAV